MRTSLTEIMDWDERFRLKFINSISGYKGVHLIGSKDKEGVTNLAIFNSIVHIGSSPPLIGFIMRPLTVERNTYANIIATGVYTINHVHRSFLKEAHYTKLDNGKYEVTLEIESFKIKSDSLGKETKTAINDWIDVGFFMDDAEEKLYQQKRVKFNKEKSSITIQLDSLPVKAAIDPRHLLIDRVYSDNIKGISIDE